MLKIIFNMGVSLALAFVLCLVLLSTGILKVDRGGLWDEIETMKESAFSALGRSFEKAHGNDVDQGRSQEVPIQTEVSKSAHDQMRSQKNAPVPNGNRIKEQILVFLAENSGDTAPDVEKRLTQFLIQELGLAPGDAEEWVRMCFWKGFISLQKDRKSADPEQRLRAFNREKALKMAGFAAKGLPFMASEMRHAESSLKEMRNGSSSQDYQGDES